MFAFYRINLLKDTNGYKSLTTQHDNFSPSYSVNDDWDGKGDGTCKGLGLKTALINKSILQSCILPNR